MAGSPDLRMSDEWHAAFNSVVGTGRPAVIVPEEAVGERCELLHEVFLLNISLGVGDVIPTDEVVNYVRGVGAAPEPALAGVR